VIVEVVVGVRLTVKSDHPGGVVWGTELRGSNLFRLGSAGSSVGFSLLDLNLLTVRIRFREGPLDRSSAVFKTRGKVNPLDLLLNE
jgi:hypothetical protein